MKFGLVLRLAGVFFFLTPLAACGGAADDQGHEEDDGHAHGDEHGGEAEPEKGPNGGRMLKVGAFAVEMTIFEQGQPPQYRVFVTRDGKPVDPRTVALSVTLKRLGGQVDRFAFKPEGTYLAGQGVVAEPHSFDVDVVAVADGKRHAWSYASPEGRTRIAAAAAKSGGVVIERAGPQTIVETVELNGLVELAPTARAEVRAQFPGRVVAVYKAAGDAVRQGELLARVEANESLQTYPVRAPMSGVIAERNANVGNVAFDLPLFVIADSARLSVLFNVFPRDLALVAAGQRVLIETLDGQPVGGTTLGAYLPQGNAEAGTALMRASLRNTGGVWRPGMAVRGKVSVRGTEVPLAVRTEALQRFRDFTVVFANFGEDYEVRMLELGRSSPEWTEVKSGLAPGTPYVTKGAFLIRADVEKSGASHDH